MSDLWRCADCGKEKPWQRTVLCKWHGESARICFDCLPAYERWTGPIKRDPGRMLVVAR